MEMMELEPEQTQKQKLSICKATVNENSIHFIILFNETQIFRFNHPPLLMNYAGSNTLTHLISEYITNVWSGSIYRSKCSSSNGFRGERRFLVVIVVKAQPEHITFQIQTANMKEISTLKATQ